MCLMLAQLWSISIFGQYWLQCPNEMDTKQMYAMSLTSKNRNKGEIYIKWMLIQDIIGTASKWPLKVRRWLWKPNECHFWQRTRIAAFTYVNGLNPKLLQEWMILLNFSERQIEHVMRLLCSFEQGKQYNLYEWNVSTQRHEYLSGEPKFYQHNKRYVWFSNCYIWTHFWWWHSCHGAWTASMWKLQKHNTKRKRNGIFGFWKSIQFLHFDAGNSKHFNILAATSWFAS